MNKRCDFLISEIEAYFREGIVLSDDSCHFIRSTFLDPSLSDLKAIISDQANPDKDSLMELIFSPDETLQTRIEELISGESFQKEDEKDLAAYLAGKEPGANVFVSGYKSPISVKMPAAYAHKLISHLRIKKKIDQRIIDAVDRYVPEKDRRHVKVRLRNSDFKESEPRINFLCVFFKSANEENPFFWASLDFIFLFFEETPLHSSIGYELVKRQQYYKEKIHQAMTYEDQLRKSNMETMMMQGRRNQCINIIDLQERIDIINYLQNIIRAVHE